MHFCIVFIKLEFIEFQAFNETPLISLITLTNAPCFHQHVNKQPDNFLNNPLPSSLLQNIQHFYYAHSLIHAIFFLHSLFLFTSYSNRGKGGGVGGQTDSETDREAQTNTFNQTNTKRKHCLLQQQYY